MEISVGKVGKKKKKIEIPTARDNETEFERQEGLLKIAKNNLFKFLHVIHRRKEFLLSEQLRLDSSQHFFSFGRKEKIRLRRMKTLAIGEGDGCACIR